MKKLLRDRGLVQRGGPKEWGIQIVSSFFSQKSFITIRIQFFLSGKYSRLL